MQRQILVPLDGSELAETILPHAVLLAQATGSSLILLRALHLLVLAPPTPGTVLNAAFIDDLSAAQQAGARDYLSRIAGRLEATHVPIHPMVVEGDPATTIVAWAAQDPPLRMVAMATHGRSGLGRWVFGSVTEKVLHAVATPLLLVRAPAEETIPARPYHTIIVPVDGSRLAEQALGQVLPLARQTRATLMLVAVAPAPDEENTGATELSWAPAAHHEVAMRMSEYLTQTVERLQATNIAVQTRLVYGRPAEEILRLRQEVQADLIAMSTHGRGGIQRFWLGSTAMKVVQGATRPVLLMRA